jgi:large subunit ribosomal protein L6
MSRIGKKSLPLPAGVDATIEAGKVTVKGPKGSVTVPLHAHVKVAIEGEPKGFVVTVENPETVDDAALWGLTRQLLNNAVLGVQKPFEESIGACSLVT